MYRHGAFADTLTIDGVPHILPHKDGSGLVGVTSFLRYPEFQTSFIDHVATIVRDTDFRILVAPGSIGCEALTLALLAHQAGCYGGGGNLSIHTLDISPVFTALARQGLYPQDSIAHLPPALKSYFNEAAMERQPVNKDFAPLVSAGAVHRHITVLPPSDLLDFAPERPYDAVLSINFLQYARDAQTAYLEKIASLSKNMICINRMDEAFGPDNNPFAKAGFQYTLLPGNNPPSSSASKPSVNWNRISVFTR